MPFLIAIQKTLRVSRLVLLSMCVFAHVGWGTALADIAPSPVSGGTNLVKKGVEKTNVVMVDEVVKLRVARGPNPKTAFKSMSRSLRIQKSQV